MQSQSPAVSSDIAMNKNVTSQITADISVEDLLQGFVSWLLMSLSFFVSGGEIFVPYLPFHVFMWSCNSYRGTGM